MSSRLLGPANGGRAPRPPRVRHLPAQPDDLTCEYRTTHDRAVGDGFRWAICGLLFLAATINYIDRQVIGILKPTLQGEFGWSEIDYSDIVFAFQLAYAIGFIFAGRLMDRVGTKIGFSLALTIWSIAAVAHAARRRSGRSVAVLLGFAGLNYSASVAGFIAARFALGLGESGNFPAAIKTVAEWFPQRRARVRHRIFNAGTNIGAIITPHRRAVSSPYASAGAGRFVATGLDRILLAGVVVAALRPARTAPAPRRRGAARTSTAIRRIRSCASPWRTLLAPPPDVGRGDGEVHDRSDLVGLPVLDSGFLQPQVRTVAAAARPADHRRLSRIATSAASFGGWLSSTLITRGWTVNGARKTAMLVVRDSPSCRSSRRSPGRQHVDGGRARSASPPRRIRAGPPTSTRSPRTCSRGSAVGSVDRLCRHVRAPSAAC